MLTIFSDIKNRGKIEMGIDWGCKKMFDFSDSLNFNRINPILSDFNNYRKRSNEKKKKNKKEYSEIMKKIANEIEKSDENGHINLKI